MVHIFGWIIADPCAYCRSLRFSADFDLNSNFLRLGVGCHDRLCCCSCGFSCSCKLWFQHFHTGCDLIDRDLFSDNTGRCNENGVLWNGKCSGCCLCGFSAVAIALLAGACIGDSAVADDCLCGWMVVYNLAIPFDRSCFYDVCSKVPAALSYKQKGSLIM